MFVIVDPARSSEEMPGFAQNTPIEGWIFTVVLSSATRFTTEAEARKVIKSHYPGQKQLQIKPVTERK